ncbi:MAG: aminoacyl-tRNA hydrolase [Clostridium sp.]|jgi:PTH1 family peptidyl-tRNA hydrolase|nr:aminoacyl-tRNA hydrolase [Clostridium sp.]
MYLIAGLGNPGRKYQNSRHNVGFNVIDLLARQEGIRVLDCRQKALVGKGRLGGEGILLAKPQTYMNLSGESIRGLADYYKIETTRQLIVISDDVSLNAGQLRIRKQGSAGGHNGLKDIIAHLGHDQFIRVRIGVGGKPEGYDLADYVLGHFSPQEQKIIETTAKTAADAVRLIIGADADTAMNRYNTRNEKGNKAAFRQAEAEAHEP